MQHPNCCAWLNDQNLVQQIDRSCTLLVLRYESGPTFDSHAGANKGGNERGGERGGGGMNQLHAHVYGMQVSIKTDCGLIGDG